MQHLPTLEVMARAIRAEVCPQCSQREPHGLWPLDQPRPCEAQCTIFINLPTLRNVAEQIDSPFLLPYERAMEQLICQSCTASPTAGDFCTEKSMRHCPLSRYAGLVVDVLERVDRAQSKRTA